MAAKVYFSAVADKGGNYGPFPEKRPLEFQTVVTSCESYDPASGIFQAPVSGYYLFSFFYQASKETQSGLSLLKNNNVIVQTCDIHRSGNPHIDNGGNIAILKLNDGDTVSVQLPANTHVHATDRVTTFSGFLIAQD